MCYSNIIILCIDLQELHSVLNEVAIEWVTQTLCYIALFFKCYIVFLKRLLLNGLLKHYNILHCSSRATYCSYNFLMRLPLNGSLKHYATLHCSSSATFCS